MPGTPFFSWPQPFVRSFLGATPLNAVFIPFAAVTISFDDYEARVAEAFHSMGHRVTSVHRAPDKQEALVSAQAIIVGGGNSFALLSRLHAEGLVDTIQSCVRAGTPYIGWSAGANVACPTIATTNDMPVIVPPAWEALQLVPFQLNPHYHELRFENQGGETRRERLAEFLVLNPDKKVVGLPEGMLLERTGDRMVVRGSGTARLFESGKEVADLPAGMDASFLLQPR